MSFNNLSILDVSYDNKAYGNLIDPYEWNNNFLKIEEIFNKNKQTIEDNFGNINALNVPSEALEKLGQTLPSNVRDQLILIVDLLINKLDRSEFENDLSGLLKGAELDPDTGIVTFTKFDGSTFTIDFATEKIPAKFELVESGSDIFLRITNIDGSYSETNVTALLNIYLFNNSDSVEFETDGYNVTAKIKSGSINKSHMDVALIQFFDETVAKVSSDAMAAESAKNDAIFARDSAKSSADEAKVSENNSKSNKEASEANAVLAKSYAVGGTETRTNEDTDNAEYYMLQSKKNAEVVDMAKQAAIAAADRAEYASQHPPMLNSLTRTWYVWQDGAYVDTGISASELRDLNSGNYIKMWFGSVEEYNALTVIEPDILYHILLGEVKVHD